MKQQTEYEKNATHIRVKKQTKTILTKLKKHKKESYDDVIIRLIGK